MNRTVKALAAALLALGIGVAGLPLGGAGATIDVGSSGCCKN